MSKIDKARRGFLKLMPAAPLAATVAAKEAAASMGLSGPLNAMSYLGNVGMAGYGSGPPTMSNTPWFVDAYKNFMSPDTIEQHRASAKGQARLLDADIAAMRSISPAQAYAMQVDRCFERLRKQEKSFIDKEMERWTKDNPSAAFAQKVLGS
jgi:hypothetical protein